MFRAHCNNYKQITFRYPYNSHYNLIDRVFGRDTLDRFSAFVLWQLYYNLSAVQNARLIHLKQLIKKLRNYDYNL